MDSKANVSDKKGRILVVPAGDSMDNALEAMNIYSPERVYILDLDEYSDESENFRRQIETTGVDVKIIRLGESIWEDVLTKVGSMVCSHSGIESDPSEKEFVVHTDTGDSQLKAIMTTAAFVNNLKALSFEGGETKLLPMFNLRYHTMLTDKKMQILKLFQEDLTCCKSFEELSRKTGMSLPLISYHINGNLKSEGLKTLGLLDVVEVGGRMNVNLTTQGRMLLKGYVRPHDSEGHVSNSLKVQQPC